MIAPYPTKEQFLEYEIHASWWAWLVPLLFEDLVARYFARKIDRKYAAYMRSRKIAKLIERGNT